MSKIEKDPHTGAYIWVHPSLEGGVGGFTFLEHVLGEHIKSGKPVLLTDGAGGRLFEYQWHLKHSTFAEGMTPKGSVEGLGKGSSWHSPEHLRAIFDDATSKYSIAFGTSRLIEQGIITRDQVQARGAAAQAAAQPKQG